MTDAEPEEAPVDEWSHALQYVNNDMHAELEYVRTWADSVEFDYDEGPNGIGFTKNGATYWYLIDDIGWDSDDPRGEVIAELIKQLESARRERDEARDLTKSYEVSLATEQSMSKVADKIAAAASHVLTLITAERNAAKAEAEQLRAERDAAVHTLNESVYRSSVTAEILDRFTRSGYGRKGEANTVWAMVHAVCDHVDQLRASEAKTVDGIATWLASEYGHSRFDTGGLFEVVNELRSGAWRTTKGDAGK